MSDLIVIAYEDEFKAEEIRLALAKLHKEHLIELEDAAVVVKNEKGEVKLKHAINLTALGAANMGFWGLLIGILFSAPLVGVAVGAATGAAAGALGEALSDVGVDDDFIRELGETIQPGTSALFILVQKVTPEKVLGEVAPHGGKVLRTSLSKDQEHQLQDVLSHHGIK